MNRSRGHGLGASPSPTHSNVPALRPFESFCIALAIAFFLFGLVMTVALMAGVA